MPGLISRMTWSFAWGPEKGPMPAVGAHKQELSRIVPPCLEKQGPIQIASSATKEAIFKYLIAFVASGVLHTPFL